MPPPRAVPAATPRAPRIAAVRSVFLGGLLAIPSPLLAHPGHALAFFAAAPAERGAPPTTKNPATALPAAVASVVIAIADAATGQPTAVRVRVTDAAGQPVGAPSSPNLNVGAELRLAAPGTVAGLPAEAIAVMYGQNDTAQGFAFQPDGAFYVKGTFTLPLPAGTFQLVVSKGYEYVHVHDTVTVRAGDRLRRDYQLERWSNLPARGWYGADDHIHLRRSPRENPLILDWLDAEDLHVGVLLQMGDFWTTYFSQYAFGRAGRYLADRRLLLSGQEEPRTNELGHTISFGAEQFVRFPGEYFSYDRVFDRIHQLGGVSGYAHEAMSFQGHRGMTLDVLTGKIDFLELAQFCVSEGPLALAHYYRFLDLGHRVTALAGSDFPWCGRGRRAGEDQVGPRIGDARFYTLAGNPFSFERWFAAVKAGHTFVTTGPMLECEVNGRPPGSALDVARGARLRVTARAHGHPQQVPLQRLQLIGHGRVLAEVRPGAAGQTAARLELEHEFSPEHGLWLAARADGGPSQVSHTTPVYVTVGGDGFHNRTNLAAQIATSRRALQEIRDLLTPTTAASRPMGRAAPPPASYPQTHSHLVRRLAAAEAALDALARRAASP